MLDITIRPFVEKNALMFKTGTPIKTVVNLLFEHGLTGAPVIDENHRVKGFISEKDCIGKLLLAAYYCDQVPTVEEMMTHEVITVTPDDKLVDVAQMMVESPPKLYPVIEDERCVGVISRSDIMQALFTHVDHCFK